MHIVVLGHSWFGFRLSNHTIMDSKSGNRNLDEESDEDVSQLSTPNSKLTTKRNFLYKRLKLAKLGQALHDTTGPPVNLNCKTPSEDLPNLDGEAGERISKISDKELAPQCTVCTKQLSYTELQPKEISTHKIIKIADKHICSDITLDNIDREQQKNQISRKHTTQSSPEKRRLYKGTKSHSTLDSYSIHSPKKSVKNTIFNYFKKCDKSCSPPQSSTPPVIHVEVDVSISNPTLQTKRKTTPVCKRKSTAKIKRSCTISQNQKNKQEATISQNQKNKQEARVNSKSKRLSRQRQVVENRKYASKTRAISSGHVLKRTASRETKCKNKPDEKVLATIYSLGSLKSILNIAPNISNSKLFIHSDNQYEVDAHKDQALSPFIDIKTYQVDRHTALSKRPSLSLDFYRSKNCNERIATSYECKQDENQSLKNRPLSLKPSSIRDVAYKLGRKFACTIPLQREHKSVSDTLNTRELETILEEQKSQGHETMLEEHKIRGYETIPKEQNAHGHETISREQNTQDYETMSKEQKPQGKGTILCEENPAGLDMISHAPHQQIHEIEFGKILPQGHKTISDLTHSKQPPQVILGTLYPLGHKAFSNIPPPPSTFTYNQLSNSHYNHNRCSTNTDESKMQICNDSMKECKAENMRNQYENLIDIPFLCNLNSSFKTNDIILVDDIKEEDESDLVQTFDSDDLIIQEADVIIKNS